MDKKKVLFFAKMLLLAGDVLCFCGAFLLAYYLRFYLQLVPLRHTVPPLMHYIQALPFIALIVVLAFNYAGLYFLRVGRSRFDELTSVFAASAGAFGVMLALTFFLREISYSRVVMLYSMGLGIVSAFLWRLIFRGIYNTLNRKGYLTQTILIVGAGDIAGNMIERINWHPEMGYKILGCATDKLKKGKKFKGISVLGRVKELDKIIKKLNPDEVFIGLPDYNRRDIADTILANENVKFMIATDILGIITKNIDYGEINGIPVFTVKELPLNLRVNRVIKRTMDIIVSGVSLLILSPLFIIVAVLIKLSSPGPVFYRQDRVGRDNKVFWMYKFRSMKTGAETKTGPVWAKENDERRTAIGTFLRKSSIDELPQLINVLKGEMSIVGPRPERPHFVEKFKNEIPRYIERHKVKAGLTGWAAANGLRGNTSLEERIKYDLYYIENWSLWFDFKIIIKTALEMFHHKGAY